ncbi:hypothetical protein EYF80_027773 [Liparis tanakae]|uniref:Uncharacterized protein n=1 Tax=Liparis tanakae TaxID=230148 RepID=A0A4Z2H9V7_9TELE|nr:hypothetical protein EYF80_027773 [Liparis tanakae]
MFSSADTYSAQMFCCLLEHYSEPVEVRRAVPRRGGISRFTCDGEHHAGDLVADRIACDALVATTVGTAHVSHLEITLGADVELATLCHLHTILVEREGGAKGTGEGRLRLALSAAGNLDVLARLHRQLNAPNCLGHEGSGTHGQSEASPYSLTSLLDAELYIGADSPHRADRLALILALVVGRHPSDAQSAGGQDHVAAVEG